MPTSPPNPNSPTHPNAPKRETKSAEQELAPEDFYYEGPYLVFTAAYHLKRGYCCNSGCRHCPYGDLA
jgi:Family of unknown function (DUF5522)